MDIVKIFLNSLNLPPEERQPLKARILADTLERALIKLSQTLPADEQQKIVDAVLHPASDNQALLSYLFQRQDSQEILADSLLSVSQPLIDDPEVVPTKKRDQVLANLETWLTSQQPTAA